jgi:hypothetical protein
MVAIYSQLCGGNKFPFLFEVGKQYSIIKQARDSAIEIEADKLIAISAVIVDNDYYKLVANFYYKFNKPQKSYKF